MPKTARTPTVREMKKRVSRYEDLKPQPWIFIDFALPEGKRDILAIIGHGVKDRESLAVPPHIQDVGSFHMAMIRCKPGKGASLHAHETEEVFMCLDGKWSVFWGDKGEKEVVLERYDTVSVPAGVMRGFRNVGNREGHLLGVLGGSDPGMLTWSPRVLKAAKERGYELDGKGHIRPIAQAPIEAPAPARKRVRRA